MLWKLVLHFCMIHSQLWLISYDSWLMSHKKWRITEYYSQKSILLLPKHLQRSLCWLYCNQWCLESQLRRHQKQTLQYRFEFFQGQKVSDTSLKLLEQALEHKLCHFLLNYALAETLTATRTDWLSDWASVWAAQKTIWGPSKSDFTVISYLIVSW